MRSNCFSCSTRSSLACVSSAMSPISSRNRVPPSAASNLPSRRATAPVNAPFSWPNSSLSTSSRENAAQLTGMNGPLARGLRLWIARAPDHSGKASAFEIHLLDQPIVGAAQQLLLHHVADFDSQLVIVERLGQVIFRAGLHRFDRDPLRSV